MYTDLKKTIADIDRSLLENGSPLSGLKRAYRHTERLRSQLLAAIYDVENYGGTAGQESFAEELSMGEARSAAVTLTILEPLPAMKKLTEAVEEHWKAMIHAAIAEAARQGPLPHFDKAFVEIEIVTPRGSDNARVWDTSNRAINVVINNLKGIFFHDDDMEHMAFSVVGRWGEKGVTILRISAFDK